jgi:hypothetical protein
MLHQDTGDPAGGGLLETPSGTPGILAGPDDLFGTDDDVPCSYCFGDVDLVVRTGIGSFGSAFPPQAIRSGFAALPLAVAEPFGQGTPIPFVVGASDGSERPAAGNPVSPPSLVDVPILALAFGDLDGDGVIGVTLLDGNALDAPLEEEELRPLGRRFAPSSGGRASGELFVAAGGPAGAELLVAVGAAAYAGPFRAQHFGGKVPDGPMVMTQLPFRPRTEPDAVIDGAAPGAADPDALAGVQVEEAYLPDPAHGTVGESFTLRPMKPDPSLDFARAHAGELARFGLARVPSPANYRSLPGRPLRPGLDGAGARAVYEVLQQLHLPDDGGASTLTARILPLDRLGNVADVPAARSVTLRAGGGVAILAPDGDGDPAQETFPAANARGVAVVLGDASGGSFDDPDGFLDVESAEGLHRLEIYLPDADVDDSGFVDAADVALVAAAEDAVLGDPAYDPRLDLSGNGRIRGEDVALVEDQLGGSVPVP